jgi:hypothetical protein
MQDGIRPPWRGRGSIPKSLEDAPNSRLSRGKRLSAKEAEYWADGIEPPFESPPTQDEHEEAVEKTISRRPKRKKLLKAAEIKNPTRSRAPPSRYDEISVLQRSDQQL